MRKVLSRVYLVIVFLFLYAPILLMIFYSFNDNPTSITIFKGFTLNNYFSLFKNEGAVEALMNTLAVAGCSSVLSSLLGTTAAVGIYNVKKKKARDAIINVSNIPIINPEIVTGISLMLVFIAIFGNKLGFFTVLIAHVVFNTPYVILNIMPRLRRMDISMYEAALDLGCTPSQGFARVVLPEIFPGILAGFLTAFTYSLDDFVISYFTGGTFQTLSVYINNSLKKGVKPWMLSLSGLLFVVVFLALLIINIKDSRAEQNQKSS